MDVVPGVYIFQNSVFDDLGVDKLKNMTTRATFPIYQLEIMLKRVEGGGKKHDFSRKHTHRI